MALTGTAALDAVRAASHPLAGTRADYDPLLDLVGDARFVLLGEASHGTHEFYRERATITRRLILEKGFNAVAVEADWPDAYRVNCYVRGRGNGGTADAALSGFKRFPTWMWRNRVVLDFVDWLRQHNLGRPGQTPQVGFYGLDLYSLQASLEAVIDYLERVDPRAAAEARERYSCFDVYLRDPQTYGLATSFGAAESCRDAVVQQLVELQRREPDYTGLDGRVSEDEHFFAEQNARLAMNAEAYYRTMYEGRASSWNLRDRHMADSLGHLVDHLERQTGQAKVVVWAHNSHLGDARATEMGRGGELNLGQLVRERYPDDAVLVGFSTYSGTVTAASDWGAPAENKRVRPALPDSYEALFHQAGGDFLLNLRGDRQPAAALRQPRLERAIGVVYRPQTERWSHYFEAELPAQFDVMLHFDETRAVEPLERTPQWDTGEPPETYPHGL